MSLSTLGVDAYQLTTLSRTPTPGGCDQRLAMAFFFRKLPRERNFVVFCGLRADPRARRADALLDRGARRRCSGHPLLGPALARAPERCCAALRDFDGFHGDIDGAARGHARVRRPRPARRRRAARRAAARASRSTRRSCRCGPTCSRAKLIETPWLVVASTTCRWSRRKAARVVIAAAGKPVLEFGQRRTHPDAAVDAVVRGVDRRLRRDLQRGAPTQRWGVPAHGHHGSLHHPGGRAAGRVHRRERARRLRRRSRTPSPTRRRCWSTPTTPMRGIRNAVAATGGKLTGMRLDSQRHARARCARARALLDELGAPQAKIFVSDGLDECARAPSWPPLAPTASAWARTSPARPTPRPASARSPR